MRRPLDERIQTSKETSIFRDQAVNTDLEYDVDLKTLAGKVEKLESELKQTRNDLDMISAWVLYEILAMILTLYDTSIFLKHCYLYCTLITIPGNELVIFLVSMVITPTL